MDSHRFQLLLDSYLSGSSTPAEEAELEQLLRGDANRRRQFAERLLLEVHLRKAFAGIAVPRPRRPRWFPALRLVVGLSAAAALLLALGVGLLRFLSRGNGQGDIRSNDVLGGEVRVDGAAVKHIPDEHWFEIAGDIPAVVRLPDTSEATFAPATRAIIHIGSDKDRPAVELERGNAGFKVTARDAPFRVKTAVGTVTVVGTEFSVKLEPRSRPRNKHHRRERGEVLLRVTVKEGSVKVEVQQKSYLLAAGESRVFGERRKKEEDDDD